jgi:hypothetical protein
MEHKTNLRDQFSQGAMEQLVINRPLLTTKVTLLLVPGSTPFCGIVLNKNTLPQHEPNKDLTFYEILIKTFVREQPV